jgi:uncharacterized protein (DUF885 family)
MLRAARLVVDTGIHALGWPRQQAVDYLNANTANPPWTTRSRSTATSPGRARRWLQIGQLRIAALRARAQAALGPRFDVRAFHDAVLDNGALPLDVLERQVGAGSTTAIAGASRSAPEPATVH